MRFLIASAALAAIALSAVPATAADLAPFIGAADTPAPAAQPAPGRPSGDWTGFYAGATVGLAIGDNALKPRSADPNFFGALDVAGFGKAFNTEAFTGGIQGGYNHQFGSWLVGVEADFSYADLDARRVASAFESFGPNVGTSTLDAGQSVEWYGTLRPRLGYLPTDDLLIYATGGLAYGKVKTHTGLDAFSGDPSFPGYAFSGAKDDWRVGWTLGGGGEYALTDSLTLKGEYLYVDLGGESTVATSGQIPLSYSVRDDAAFHVIRTGLNYRF